MDQIDALFHDLSRISSSMEAVEKIEDAEVRYDTLSGSLIWSDELPKSGEVSLDCLRFVLKYRTGLIVGKPQPTFELFWQEANRRFPGWIGFSVDRTSPNDVLTNLYSREQKRVETEAE